MPFPVEVLGGKCDPEFAFGMGWVFRPQGIIRDAAVPIGADFIPFGKMRHAVRKNETREIACFV